MYVESTSGGAGAASALPSSPSFIPGTGLRKASSCSTVLVDDSTISQPNLKLTIKCISLAIYYHIINRSNRGRERVMNIFDEKMHPLTRERYKKINFWPIPVLMLGMLVLVQALDFTLLIPVLYSTSTKLVI